MREGEKGYEIAVEEKRIVGISNLRCAVQGPHGIQFRFSCYEPHTEGYGEREEQRTDKVRKRDQRKGVERNGKQSKGEERRAEESRGDERRGAIKSEKKELKKIREMNEQVNLTV